VTIKRPQNQTLTDSLFAVSLDTVAYPLKGVDNPVLHHEQDQINISFVIWIFLLFSG